MHGGFVRSITEDCQFESGFITVARNPVSKPISIRDMLDL